MAGLAPAPLSGFVREHAVTLDEALSLPALRAGAPEVVAGRSALGRSIRWVHAGEFPEMATVLKGGELLLTTGMGLPERDRDAAAWLADLDRCGIAGLVIELGSALSTVPESIVNEARARNLPLIVLHRQVAFVEITEVVHREILDHRGALLERGEKVSRRLSLLLLDGAGVAEMIEALAELVDEAVVLARAAGGILFQANHGLRDADVAGLWESRRRRLEGTVGAFELPVRLGGDPHWAELAVIPGSGTLGDAERATAEHAVPFIALALKRDRELHELAARARGEFLFTLAQRPDAFSEREALAKARALGFDDRSGSLLPVVADCRAGESRIENMHLERLAGDARGRLHHAGHAAITGIHPSVNGIVLVVSLADERHRRRIAGEVASILHRLAEESPLHNARVRMSVGRAAPTWRRLGPAMRDTIGASSAATCRPEAAWHDVQAIDLADLLWSIRESSTLARLVQERLQPLVEHDRNHRSSLVETLDVYYRHGCRKADAARALHLERQSLYKRLARIEDLLGVDLDDPDIRLALHLALRARPLLNGIADTTPPGHVDVSSPGHAT